MSKRFKKHNNYHSRQKWYVTVYQEYPIYEPAEGGYYYAGIEIDKSFVFYDYKRAKQFYDKHIDDIEFNFYSKYIGDSIFTEIEQTLGRKVSGRQIYC